MQRSRNYFCVLDFWEMKDKLTKLDSMIKARDPFPGRGGPNSVNHVPGVVGHKDNIDGGIRSREPFFNSVLQHFVQVQSGVVFFKEAYVKG